MFVTAVALVALVGILGEWLGLFEGVTTPVPAWLTISAVLLGGFPIFRNVLRALRNRTVTSHALMTIGIVGALAIGQIDGLCASTFYHLSPTLSLSEQLRISPKWSNADMTRGSTFMAHVLQAALAIEAGLCSRVLILYGSAARSTRDIYGLIDLPTLQASYAPLLPVGAYAMAAARHMHQYGTTRRHLAEVAVAARKWAQLTPDAALREPLTIEDVLASPMVCDPLSRLDCCLVSDGGGALIMTSAERALDMAQPPVYVLGVGTAHCHRDISQMPDLTTTGAVESGARAYEMAGVAPSEGDVLQLYDAFTILPILFLEDLGFCKKGEGGPFVADGGDHSRR